MSVGPRIVLNEKWQVSSDTTGKGPYVVYGNEVFVNLGGSSKITPSNRYIRTSTDGVNWTQRANFLCCSLNYSNGWFVTTDMSLNAITRWSTDGITWNGYQTTSYGAGYYYTCTTRLELLWSDGRDVWIGFGFNGDAVVYVWGQPNNALGEVSGQIDMPGSSIPRSVACSSTNTIVCITNGTKYVYGNNVILFTPYRFENITTYTFQYGSGYQTVIYDGPLGNKKFIVVGINYILSGTDGINWTYTNTSTSGDFSGITINWTSVTYATPVSTNIPSYYVAVGYSTSPDISRMAYSTDGITWKSTGTNISVSGQMMAVTASTNKIVAVSLNANNILTNFTDVKCFLEGSKIVCMVHGEEKFVEVQNLKPGVLVKTLSNGYKPVEHVGTAKIYNPANKLRGKNRLYKLTPEKYPALTEDLILTGCHSILLDDDLSEEQRSKSIELTGDVFITEDRYRLMACIDERAEPYEVEGVYTVWHFSLEHPVDNMNYGVYANGLLPVETASKRGMIKYGGLELIE